MKIRMNQIVLACAAALPVCADGLYRGGVFERQFRFYEDEHVVNAADYCLSVYYHEKNGREEKLAAAIRELREMVEKYPDELNDCVQSHGASTTALSVAVELGDVELVRFLLDHGAHPFFGMMGEMEKVLAPDSKTNPEIVKMLREARKDYSPLEGAIAATYLPERHNWVCDFLYYGRKDMPRSVDSHAAFDRLPKAAEWGRIQPVYKYKTHAVVVEGLTEQADGVAFVAASLGVSKDGRILVIDRQILREGEENPAQSTGNYWITNTPYVFTKPQADGRVVMLLFDMAEDKQTLQKLTCLTLSMQGEVLRSEQIYPHAHSGSEYKQVGGRTVTEGFELPAADVLLNY